MFVKSRHARRVAIFTLVKAFSYSYLLPRSGYYKRLRDRFGSHVSLFLNSELVLHSLLKSFPDKHPGMIVLIDKSIHKRFAKVVSRLGLRMVAYKGERELFSEIESDRVLLIVLPDSFRVMSPKSRSKLEKANAPILLYQNSKRPKPTVLKHDFFVWEPRDLPRSTGGSVLVCANEKYKGLLQTMKSQNSARPRLSSWFFVGDIARAIRGYENRYRRIDRRPAAVVARLLYDVYR